MRVYRYLTGLAVGPVFCPLSMLKEAEAYRDKQQEYFRFRRDDIIELIPPGERTRVLEVGAAEGSTLVDLKRAGKAAEVVGVELLAMPGSGQNHPEIDRFVIADVEQKNLDFPPESFDIVICGDLLEHLRDPWSAFDYVVGFLRPGGRIIVSLPNILYWRAIGRILLGDFRYAPSGVLDRTHLRFFCRKNMIDLIKSAKLGVMQVEPSFRRQKALRMDRLLNALSLGLAERFLAQQYLIVAEKPRA